MVKGWNMDVQNNLLAACFDDGALVVHLGSNTPLASC